MARLSFSKYEQYMSAFTVEPYGINSRSITPRLSQKTEARTFFGDKPVLNFLTASDPVCFHCIEALFVSGVM
ncbi:hypothetical protein PGB90_009033 [Kerria lacca]